MSTNTPVTLRSLSKHWYILWVTERSWFMQETWGRTLIFIKPLLQVVELKSLKDFTADRQQRDESVGFNALLILFCVDQNKAGFLPFCRKFLLTKRWLEKNWMGFTNKNDHMISIFEYWSSHGRELCWIQGYSLSLTYCHSRFGHDRDVFP